MYTCIWPLASHNKHKPLQFINTSLVVSHLLFTSQKERKAMKDEATRYGTMGKSYKSVVVH